MDESRHDIDDIAATRAWPWLWRSSRGRDLTLIATALLLIFAAFASHPPLRSSSRYYVSVREMVASGDWIVPTLNGVPYAEKPIFSYWLGAFCRVITGGADIGWHLPAALASLVSLFVVYAWGSELRGRGFGLVTALALLASGLFLPFTAIFTTDPILAACLAVAFYAFWKHDRSTDKPGRWTWIFWSAVGLGFMTKGPVAIALLGAAIGAFAFLSGGWRGLWQEGWRLCPLRGLALVIAINLPWSIAVWMRDPRLLEFFYVRVNFQAFLDASEINHPGDWWFYLPVFLAATLPWTLLAMPLAILAVGRALALAVRVRLGEPEPELSAEERRARRDRLWLAAAVVFPAWFLSLNASKLGTYLLPVLPPLVLLIGDRLAGMSGSGLRWWRWSLLAQAGLVIVAAIGALVMVRTYPDLFNLNRIDLHWSPVLALALLALLAGLVWGGLALRRGEVSHGILRAGAGQIVGVILLLPTMHHWVNDLDGSRMGTALAAVAGKNDRIVLNAELVNDHTIVWALNRPLDVIGSPRELGMGMFTSVTKKTLKIPPNVYEIKKLRRQPRMVNIRQLHEGWASPQRWWLFADEDTIRDLTKLNLPMHALEKLKGVTLISNQPVPGHTQPTRWEDTPPPPPKKKYLEAIFGVSKPFQPPASSPSPEPEEDLYDP